MEVNELVKKLRQERNISQRHLVEGISERSTLASFEQKGQRISFHILQQYLERLNITLEEFEYLLQGNQLNEKRKLSKKMYRFYLQEEYEKIASLIAIAEQSYLETHDFFYYVLFAQYSLILAEKKNIRLENEAEMSRVIRKYLDRVETWGKFELTLFVNTLFLFSDEYIMYQLKQLKRKNFSQHQLNKNYLIYTKLLTNAMFLFLDRATNEYVDSLFEYIQQTDSFDDEQFMLI